MEVENLEAPLKAGDIVFMWNNHPKGPVPLRLMFRGGDGYWRGIDFLWSDQCEYRLPFSDSILIKRRVNKKVASILYGHNFKFF